MKSRPPTIETIAIGDEVISGRIADTNSSFVSEQLALNGLWVARHNAIGDDTAHIIAILKEVAERAEVVICFGGLGPTSDDKTAAAVAQLLGCELVEHAQSKTQLLALLKERGREVTPQVLKQVVHPRLSAPFLNTNGLAPGFGFILNNCHFFFLPGVPSEMRRMFQNDVLPALTENESRSPLLVRTWKCFGLPESELQRLMVPLEAHLPEVFWLGYRTRPPENHLTLYGRPNWESSVTQKEARELEVSLRQVVAPWCFTDDSKDLETLVIEELLAKKLTLAVVESCTGGLVSHRLTSVPGSSAVFFGGMTVYQREAKNRLLGLDLKTESQTVSDQCTRNLAVKALDRCGVSLSAAITGYMGPTGGTLEDPVGTVYIATAGAFAQQARIRLIARERSQNLSAAASHVLYLLLSNLRKG